MACPSSTCNMIMFHSDFKSNHPGFFLFLSGSCHPKHFVVSTYKESPTFLHPERSCRWLHLAWRSKGGGEEDRAPLKKTFLIQLGIEINTFCIFLVGPSNFNTILGGPDVNTYLAEIMLLWKILDVLGLCPNQKCILHF